MDIILYVVLPQLFLSKFVKIDYKIMYFVFTPSKKLKLSHHVCTCVHTAQ